MPALPAPRLSLILCSRNDAYRGNSRWRLETALNYAGEQVKALGRESEVEVVVADWGSDVPLRDVTRLTAAASRIVRFVTIPKGDAVRVQGDSPFPEVIALNVAARRSRGEYIGRIDQDTLTGDRFLRWFFDAIESGRAPAGERTMDQTLFFANRRSIPYRLAVLCPPYAVIERFVGAFRDRLKIETGQKWFCLDVGVWMAHRDLWNACGGYDERMIYMNDMEAEMIRRLLSRGHPLVDLGKIVGYDFYHLDHYHPRGSRSSSTHRKVNSHLVREDVGVRPSGEGWGLAALPLDVSAVAAETVHDVRERSILEAPRFFAYAGYTGFRLRLDRVIYPLYPKWARRARIARATVRGHSILRGPSILWKIWGERGSQGSQGA